MTALVGRRGVLAALGLAVLAVLGVVLPEPIDLGEDGAGALEIWTWITLGVGGAVFLALLVSLAAGRGWGPAGPRRPETAFGVEVLAALAGFFLLPALCGGVALALLGDGLHAILLGGGTANIALIGIALVIWSRAEEGRALVPFRTGTLGTDLLVGAALALAVLPVLNGATKTGAVLLRAIDRTPELQHLVILIRDEPSVLVLAGAAVFTVILAPLAEELVFRGFLYTGLRHRAGPAVAAVSSALVFSLIHLSPYAALPLFGLGLALALLYERNGSLAAPVALHAAFNAIQFVGILLYPGGGG